MPKSICATCGASQTWEWEDAFDIGLGHFDETRKTQVVAEALVSTGYAVKYHSWGAVEGNITSIKKDGVEQIPETADVGYDNPRTYLPAAIITVLDEKLPVAEGVRR